MLQFVQTSRYAFGGVVSPQQQRGEETRTRIMEVAEESFARQGYDATGIAEICRRAGVSKGAFYHHFASKQELFLALLDAWLARLDAQLESVRQESATVPEAILRMVDRVQPIFQEQRGQLPIIFEFWMQAAHDPAVWQTTIAPYRRYRDYLAEMIRAGVAEGTLHVDDADLAAQALISLMVGLLLQGLLDSDETDWGSVARQSMQMLLQSLKG